MAPNSQLVLEFTAKLSLHCDALAGNDARALDALDAGLDADRDAVDDLLDEADRLADELVVGVLLACVLALLVAGTLELCESPDPELKGLPISKNAITPMITRLATKPPRKVNQYLAVGKPFSLALLAADDAGAKPKMPKKIETTKVVVMPGAPLLVCAV